MKKLEELIIIGSGPAGLTAAIYAAREQLYPLLVAGRTAGGQLTKTTDVDDYPGFPEGIQGPELMEKFRSQAQRFGTRFVMEDVVSVKFDTHPFEIRTESQEFLAKVVILATGASAVWLSLPSEQKLRGRGVSACAVCDGPFFKDKRVAVVGGGDTAMREAQHLSKYAKEVLVIHRRDRLRAKTALVQLVKGKPNVDFLLNSVVEEVMGEEKVVGIKVKNIETGKLSEVAVDGLFIAIGHNPNTGFLDKQVELDERGYIKVRDDTRTSVAGVFVSGDVSDPIYRQAVTAAGAGCKAALDAEEYLEHLK